MLEKKVGKEIRILRYKLVTYRKGTNSPGNRFRKYLFLFPEIMVKKLYWFQL